MSVISNEIDFVLLSKSLILTQVLSEFAPTEEWMKLSYQPMYQQKWFAIAQRAIVVLVDFHCCRDGLDGPASC
jgi:hypothetical protein